MRLTMTRAERRDIGPPAQTLQDNTLAASGPLLRAILVLSYLLGAEVECATVLGVAASEGSPGLAATAPEEQSPERTSLSDYLVLVGIGPLLIAFFSVTRYLWRHVFISSDIGTSLFERVVALVAVPIALFVPILWAIFIWLDFSDNGILLAFVCALYSLVTIAVLRFRHLPDTSERRQTFPLAVAAICFAITSGLCGVASAIHL